MNRCTNQNFVLLMLKPERGAVLAAKNGHGV